MEINELHDMIDETGKKLAERLPKYMHGKVQFNVVDGGFVDASIELKLKRKPKTIEKQKE